MIKLKNILTRTIITLTVLSVFIALSSSVSYSAGRLVLPPQPQPPEEQPTSHWDDNQQEPGPTQPRPRWGFPQVAAYDHSYQDDTSWNQMLGDYLYGYIFPMCWTRPKPKPVEPQPGPRPEPRPKPPIRKPIVVDAAVAIPNPLPPPFPPITPGEWVTASSCVAKHSDLANRHERLATPIPPLFMTIADNSINATASQNLHNLMCDQDILEAFIYERFFGDHAFRAPEEDLLYE